MQVEGDVEERSEHGDAEEEDAGGGERHAGVLKERQREEGFDGARFDPEEESEDEGGEGEHRLHTGRSPAAEADFAECEEQGREPGAESGDAGPIDDALLEMRAEVGEFVIEDGDGEDAEGRVDVEDPAPGEIVGDPAAEDGADDGGDAEDRSEEALVAAALGGGEEIADDGEAEADDGAAADALEAAEEDELVHAVEREGNVAGRAAEAGGEDEDDGSGEIEPFAAVEVGELGEDGDGDGGGEQVGGGDPGIAVEPVEAFDDAGHGDADDGLIHGGEQEGEQHAGDGEDELAAGESGEAAAGVLRGGGLRGGGGGLHGFIYCTPARGGAL